MNNRRSRVHLHRLGISSPMFIAITLAGIFFVFGLCVLLVCSVIGGSGEKVESTERRLVYATNPASLMDACRKIVASYPTAGEAVYPDPASPMIPAIIGKVRPKTITVDKNRITLECGTNVYRFGIAVDVDTPDPPTTMPTTRPDPPMATRLLAPGIWYYAEDHAIPGP